LIDIPFSLKLLLSQLGIKRPPMWRTKIVNIFKVVLVLQHS
jgi:hypothetical protein